METLKKEDEPGVGSRQEMVTHPVPTTTAQESAMRKVLFRVQSHRVRIRIAKDIKKFDACMEEIIQHAQVVKATINSVPNPTTTIFFDDDRVIKIICQFIESSNAILRYLAFLRQRTGILSGGDPWLKKKVNMGRDLVRALLEVLTLHIKVVDRPGAEFCLDHQEDIRKASGFGFLASNRSTSTWGLGGTLYYHRPDAETALMNRLELGTVQSWYMTKFHHPTVQVPGTSWHKFFGSLNYDPAGYPMLFRPQSKDRILVLFPEAARMIEHEIKTSLATYRQVFVASERLPDDPKPRGRRYKNTLKLMKSLSLDSASRPRVYSTLSNQQFLTGPPQGNRPEHDISGNAKFDDLSECLNIPRLRGMAMSRPEALGDWGGYMMLREEYRYPWDKAGMDDEDEDGDEGDESDESDEDGSASD